MEIVAGIILIIIVVAGILAYNSICWGFVLTKLWVWYILPIFPNMPNLTTLQAIGILLVIGALTHKEHQNCKKEEDSKYSSVVALFLSPWITLLFAYIIHLFY